MAHYNLTPRVKVLADRLLAQKSTLCTEHATTLNALDGDIAGVPAAVKPARRFYELMRQLPLTISADELIVGNQTRKPHGAIFHDENATRRPSVFQFLNLNSELDSPDYKRKPAPSVAPLAAAVWMKSTAAAPPSTPVTPCWRWRKIWPTAPNSWRPRKPMLIAKPSCSIARPFCTTFRPIRRVISKKPARRSICSSWRYSWITAAMRLTRKGRISRYCLTSNAISTAARSIPSRPMRSWSACGSSWRN
ncbi:pyruvate formate-lyase [Klebsiella pneumoniae]|nr:pyruvate formate-lyase [Klebsiella pneumoniae]